MFLSEDSRHSSHGIFHRLLDEVDTAKIDTHRPLLLRNLHSQKFDSAILRKQ